MLSTIFPFNLRNVSYSILNDSFAYVSSTKRNNLQVQIGSFFNNQVGPLSNGFLSQSKIKELLCSFEKFFWKCTAHGKCLWECLHSGVFLFFSKVVVVPIRGAPSTSRKLHPAVVKELEV